MEIALADWVLKAIQQVGLPSVVVVVILFITYRTLTKFIAPVGEKLVTGHLDFLRDMKDIQERLADNIEKSACKSNLLIQIDQKADTTHKKLDTLLERNKLNG